MRARFDITKEFLEGYFSNDAAVAAKHPIATATTTRYFMNVALNTALPMLLMKFLNEKYPEAAKDMQLYLKDIQVYMAFLNIIGMSALFTVIEYAGRAYTGNLLTGPNFRKDALFGAMTALAMQTFASTEYGKANGVGKFWNNLSESDPFLLMLYTFFLVPGLLKASISLSKQVAKDVKGLVGRIADSCGDDAAGLTETVVASSNSEQSLLAAGGVHIPSADDDVKSIEAKNSQHFFSALSSSPTLVGSGLTVRGSNSTIPRVRVSDPPHL